MICVIVVELCGLLYNLIKGVVRCILESRVETQFRRVFLIVVFRLNEVLHQAVYQGGCGPLVADFRLIKRWSSDISSLIRQNCRFFLLDSERRFR